MKSIIKSAKTVEEAIELGLKELDLTREDVEIEVMQESTKGIFGLFGGSDAIVKIKEKTKLKIDIDDIFSDSREKYSNDIQIEEDEIDEYEDDFEEDEEDEEDSTFSLENDKEEIVVVEENSYQEIDSKEDFDDYSDDEFTEEEFNSSRDEYTAESDEDISLIAQKIKNDLEEILLKMHIEAKVSYSIEQDNIINLDLTDISENDTGIVIGSKGETLNALQYIINLLTNKNTNEYYKVTINVGDYRERRKKSIEMNAQKVAYKVLKSKKSIALRPMNSYERRIVHFALQNYKGIETVSIGKFPNRKVVVKYQEQ